MSRRAPTSQTPSVPPLRAQRSSSSLSSSTARIRTTSIPKAPPRSPASPSRPAAPALKPAARRPPSRTEAPPEVPKVPLSIKEQIALKRQQAKKAAPAAGSIDAFSPTVSEISVQPDDGVLELGRWTVRESIERARTSGNLNLGARSLTQIPTYLFQCHLDITPAPLTNSPPEVVEPENPKKKDKAAPAFWETNDLLVLKAWNNNIIEIQPEISMFGSLKTIDLHQNELRSLPDALADLINLVSLDVSHNLLETLPAHLPSLPFLVSLNLSHNKLSQLNLKPSNLTHSRTPSTSFFAAPAIARASKPLPSLTSLFVSNNLLTADSIASDALPQALTKVDLSENPLQGASNLMQGLAALPQLRELKMHKCGLTDAAVASTPSNPFPQLDIFDMEDNLDISEACVAAFLGDRPYTLEHATATNDMIKVTIGKKGPVKEKWEIEAERRVKPKRSAINVAEQAPKPELVLEGDPWAGFGKPAPGRRTPTPSAAKPAAKPAASPAKAKPTATSTTAAPPVKKAPPPVVKESWEIEAEQGLLTEGGKRRARAAKAAADAEAEAQAALAAQSSSPASALSPYYDVTNATLTLPSSQPLARSHNRAHSLAISSKMNGGGSDVNVPPQTVPLAVIETQGFAAKLRVLVLSSRRKDISFILSSAEASGTLPLLDELRVNGCGLTDTVPVFVSSSESSPSTSPTLHNKEPTLQLIGRLFPALGTLDISENMLTSLEGLKELIIPSGQRRGLKVFRARGNKLAQVDALEATAGGFRDGASVTGWKLEEVDIRDNEIAKLPPTLGLLPLDVLLVEGNVFRVPARRVWEREGTQGLLRWLRERVE